jgi:putative transposase
VLVNWVYACLPKLSRSTLKAKQKLRREAKTISALGGNYGHRRGTGRIDSDPDLPAAIETCLAAGGRHCLDDVQFQNEKTARTVPVTIELLLL